MERFNLEHMDLHRLVDMMAAGAIDQNALANDLVELAAKYGVDIDDARAAIDPTTV